jgi:hypothetical protein
MVDLRGGLGDGLWTLFGERVLRQGLSLQDRELRDLSEIRYRTRGGRGPLSGTKWKSTSHRFAVTQEFLLQDRTVAEGSE